MLKDRVMASNLASEDIFRAQVDLYETVHTSMASHVPKKNLTRKNGLGEGQKYYSA